MPLPGKRWFHLTLGTYGSWLPGDPSGFRSRSHRLHSGGDHRCPPPRGEHAGLHRHATRLAGPAIVLSQASRQRIGESIVHQAGQLQHRLIAVAVDTGHVHLLIELPTDRVKHEAGRLKRFASFACRDLVESRVWARGCGIKPIADRRHHEATHAYILRHATHEAWVWKWSDSGHQDQAHT